MRRIKPNRRVCLAVTVNLMHDSVGENADPSTKIEIKLFLPSRLNQS